MQQGLDITYYLITQFTGLLILAVAMIIFIFSIQKVANNLAKQIENQTSELNRLNESYQDSQKVLMSVFSQIEQIANNNNELNYNNYNYINIILVTFFLSLICQLGDLFISYFKRKAKVDDTGSILPGHGGLLDRIDGVIFVIPAAYLIDKIFF